MLTKTDGKSWDGDPAVERLVEARTVSKMFVTFIHVKENYY